MERHFSRLRLDLPFPFGILWVGQTQTEVFADRGLFYRNSKYPKTQIYMKNKINRTAGLYFINNES